MRMRGLVAWMAVALAVSACASRVGLAPKEEGNAAVAEKEKTSTKIAGKQLRSPDVVVGGSSLKGDGAIRREQAIQVEALDNPPPLCPTCYMVKRGDTLHAIALETGQDYRDIARWNNLTDLNRILVGQQLIVRGDEGGPKVATPLVSNKLPSTLSPDKDKKASITEPAAQKLTEVGTDSNSGVDWMWPHEGSRSAKFDAAKKGIDLTGRVGDAVYASAAGKVVFANNNIRSYGNLVVIKHNTEYLSAYAHNSKLLVKEGQVVKRGQKIAEMGSSDTDSVKLHFEIRRFGKPIDPLKFLPTSTTGSLPKAERVVP